jgi:2-aminoadipate transaminase
MSVEKRQGLIRLAREAGVLIVEDSPYRELKFEGESLPSIWKLSGGEGVILLKTLSKTLFPGMRLGWIAAGPEVLERIVLLKQSVDLCSPSFNQFIIARYVAQGKMRATIEKAIACYRPKRDAMVAALTRHMPAGVSWSRPEGGMFLWVTLPQKMDAKEIFEPAALGKVVYVTGRQFHCDGGGANTLRLNYSFPSLEQIETGIERLGGVIRERI